MRLWTIHPKYLDVKGLVALWREGLLAQKVLKGQTKGYRFHPQLDRFKESKNPNSSISYYLQQVYNESVTRGYNFDKSKIDEFKKVPKIKVDREEIQAEFEHLKSKLEIRDSERFHQLLEVIDIQLHPLFEFS